MHCVLRVLLIGVCMLLFLNLILNYFNKSEYTASSISRFSFRPVHKAIGRANQTGTAGSGSTGPISPINWARRQSIAPAAIGNNFTQHNNTANTNNSWPSNGNGSFLTHHKYNHTWKNIRQNHGDREGKQKLELCMPPSEEDGGPIAVNKTLESLDVIETQLGPLLSPGGAFNPSHCKANDHVAIVVPFRDRYAHLSIFLRNLHPFLMQQNISYRVFVIEQTNGRPFNRAALMNIGFLEALKIFKYDCFIFHDVDLLPLDSRNLYNCPRQPRHMSVAIDTLNFQLPYRSIFGGVSAMTRQHFEMVNGFSNSFFGWGGEDDDMSNRLKHVNLFISRYPVNIARYTMLKHQKEKANPKRYENLVNGISKFQLDGINSIKYDIYSLKEFPIFTWYLAELKAIDQKS